MILLSELHGVNGVSCQDFIFSLDFIQERYKKAIFEEILTLPNVNI